MIRTSLKNSHFNGRYVATKDFSDSVVIADGVTFQEAYEKASKKDVKILP